MYTIAYILGYFVCSILAGFWQRYSWKYPAEEYGSMTFNAKRRKVYWAMIFGPFYLLFWSAERLCFYLEMLLKPAVKPVVYLIDYVFDMR